LFSCVGRRGEGRREKKKAHGQSQPMSPKEKGKKGGGTGKKEGRKQHDWVHQKRNQSLRVRGGVRSKERTLGGGKKHAFWGK